MTLAPESKWQVGVSGAVVHDGRVLLVRHTYGPRQGHWALPGGIAAPDERLDQAVIREVREETGLDTEVIDLIGAVTRYSDNGGEVYVVFRLELCAGEAEPDQVELDAARWFTLSQVESMTPDELWDDIRRPTLAALTATTGLIEDPAYPDWSSTTRAYLVPWEKSG
jgi:ADP-ribose pyrophosphatase YjhB (NUDIX family)